MNERIRENWEKATGSAIPGPGFFASASDYNIEKFAELIVRECMEQVWYTRENVMDSNISEVIKERIKEHFGVE